ncbi:uncharacterized protein [Rutidosis leptorrhynchoides]|uniref:uncharacterized protein n=1 Tax=Rutidosis leptorrhynchoides TaxID=125765 RepID=UPI003A992F96
MDEFGVLVESIGFKAHGKSSAPLADLRKKNTHKTNNGFPKDIGIDSSNYNTINVDDLDGIFRSSNNNSSSSNLDDVFGGFKDPSFFHVSSSKNYDNDDNDVFGLRKKQNLGSNSVDHFDVLGNKVLPVKKMNSIDDLIGNFGGMSVNSSGKQSNSGSGFDDDLFGVFNGNGNGMKSNGSKKQETGFESEDLLSGFGVKSSSINGKSETSRSSKSSGHSANSFAPSAQDPFVMFERTQGSFNANYGASGTDDYLDSFFSPNAQSNAKPSQSSTSEDSVYDALFNNKVGTKVEKKPPAVRSHNTRKASSKASNTEDFSYLFGMGDAPPSGEFQEIEGESDDRRKARFNHHLTTRERMVKALNEKNQRDYQAQQEQDEKHRVAVTLEGDIKRWAIGKEGNLRALISSLQDVLWAGSGWRPISLTDLITSSAVKKAYYKATLCVHPDKVQQKGATVQQKYIAEKVFDLLKEAWNKFNAEEFKKQ